MSPAPLSDFVSKSCPNCPFRKTVVPYIRLERAIDLAYNAGNPYGTFPCHVTTTQDDDYEDDEDGEYGEGFKDCHMEKQCAGHLTIQHNENEGTYYEGFEPDPDCFETSQDMIEHYEEHFEENSF